MIGGVWTSNPVVCMNMDEVEMPLQEGEDRVKILGASEGLDASRENSKGNWKTLSQISVLILKYCITAVFRICASP